MKINLVEDCRLEKLSNTFEHFDPCRPGKLFSQNLYYLPLARFGLITLWYTACQSFTHYTPGRSFLGSVTQFWTFFWIFLSEIFWRLLCKPQTNANKIILKVLALRKIWDLFWAFGISKIFDHQIHWTQSNPCSLQFVAKIHSTHSWVKFID